MPEMDLPAVRTENTIESQLEIHCSSDFLRNFENRTLSIRFPLSA